MRTLLGVFLVAHGVITAAIWGAPKLSAPEGQVQPPDPSHSWLLGDVRGISVAFGVAVGLALAVAGFAFVTNQEWWPAAAIAAASASLVLFGVFFTPWWTAGIAISVALVIGALRAGTV